MHVEYNTEVKGGKKQRKMEYKAETPYGAEQTGAEVDTSKLAAKVRSSPVLPNGSSEEPDAIYKGRVVKAGSGSTPATGGSGCSPAYPSGSSYNSPSSPPDPDA